MKAERLLVVLLVFVLAATLAYSAGEAEKKAATAASGEPQYGGTLTFLTMTSPDEPQSWDIHLGWWQQHGWTIPYMSWLVVGDVEKYGPSAKGPGQWPFTVHAEIPEQFLKGDVAESYEIHADRFVFNIRKGIMWHGREGVMKSRELTAEDVVFSLKKAFECPLKMYPFVKGVHAQDKDTVIVDLNYFEAGWTLWFDGALAGMYPPEVYEKGVEQWFNQVGSGPFMMTDYVAGSNVKYERYPNYWEKTTIKGKQYQLPFIDTLIIPIMPDEATRIAALRTAKADGDERVAWKFRDTLLQTSPKLVESPYVLGACNELNLQCAESKYADKYSQLSPYADRKFANKNLRRALAIGTDRKAIAAGIFGKAEIHTTFGYGGPMYTPIDQLPASARELYEYNPEKAKKMIADAGYPKGFEMEMIYSAGREMDRQMAELLADQWSKIGITCKLLPVESTAHLAIRYNRQFKDVYMAGEGNQYSELIERMSNHTGNSPSYYDPVFDEKYKEAGAVMDPVKRAALCKDIILRYIDECSRIEMPTEYSITFVWPWVKNYYGGTECGYRNMVPFFSRMWIDKAVKAEMGYK